MKVVIFGTKKEGDYLGKFIVRSSVHELACYIDNSTEQQGKIINGCRVISFDEYKKKHIQENDCIIISARAAYSRLAIMEQLSNSNHPIGFLILDYPDYNIPIRSLEEAVFWIKDYGKPIMPYLECNVIDGCNLNCKGCSHFSSLYSIEDRVSVECYRKDIMRVSEMFCLVQLRILGGEPLLHPELPEIINITREYLPNTSIAVVTNGMLLLKVSQRLFNTARENKVGFHISRYRPVEDMLPQIVARLEDAGVLYRITEPISQFGKSLSMTGLSDPMQAMKYCISLGCRFLRQGKLYKCPFEGLVDRFAERFGFEDQIEFRRGIDIYDESIIWSQQLEEYYHRPVPMCHMCAEKCEMFTWSIKRTPEKMDWIV